MNTRTTNSIISGSSALERIPGEVFRLWPEARAFVIADANTWKAAGSRVAGLLASGGVPSSGPFIFPGSPTLHADTGRIAELSRAWLAKPPRVQSFRSRSVPGTLNDIVKRAAYENGLSYMCVPTAPSVDGYTSFGAAVTVNGFKTTLPCDAPASSSPTKISWPAPRCVCFFCRMRRSRRQTGERTGLAYRRGSRS